MKATTEKNIRKVIVEFVKSNKTYKKGVTELLIDDLISQLEIKEQAQADLKVRGLITNVSKDEDRPFYTVNPSKNVVHECVKCVQSLLRQLSISPDAILKLKLEESKDDYSKLLDAITNDN